MAVRSGTSSDTRRLPSFTVSGVQAGTIVLETIKRAEGSDRLILRLYESLGNRSAGSLRIQGVKLKEAFWVNMLEDILQDAAVQATGDSFEVDLKMRGFEIRTLMLDIA